MWNQLEATRAHILLLFHERLIYMTTVCLFLSLFFFPDAKYGVHRAATTTVPMIISASPSRSVMLPI